MFVYLGIIALVTIYGSNAQEPCKTPLRDQGVCISIYKCEPLLNLAGKGRAISRREERFLRSSWCGDDNDNAPKVCCPLRMEGPRASPMNKNKDPKSGPSPIPTPSSVPGPPDVTNHPNLRLVNEEICGPITESKIILGNLTTVLQYPWMALIAYNVDGRSTSFRCGGTLINKRYVLTAAHCVTGLDKGVVLAGVRVGEHNISTEEDCDQENGRLVVCANKYQNFFVRSYHFHAGYVKSKHINDIALIRLDGEADFNTNNVRPICLPVGNNVMLMSKKAIVTGWGATESHWRSDALLTVKLGLISNKECAKVYGPMNIEISYKQICAGGHSRMDSCAGDSGGPLQSYDLRSPTVPKFIQYGIVSFGPRMCGSIGSPGVYTKVAYYMDWILDTIRE